ASVPPSVVSQAYAAVDVSDPDESESLENPLIRRMLEQSSPFSDALGEAVERLGEGGNGSEREERPADERPSDERPPAPRAGQRPAAPGSGGPGRRPPAGARARRRPGGARPSRSRSW